MSDITIIKEKKGSYECVIELNRKLDLSPYGKFKVINCGFIRISDIMLNKLKEDFYCNYDK